MSDTNITLTQSAISLIDFLPDGICYLLVSRLGLWHSSQQRILKKSNLVI